MIYSPGCLAQATQGAICPPGANSLEIASHHLIAFQIFTSVVFGLGFLSLLLLLGASALLKSLTLESIGELPFSTSTYRIERVIKTFLFRRKLFAWLALSENSPNLV